MKLVDAFEKQMIFEKETAKSLRSMASKTQSSIPKLIFKTIELDTTRHAHMYATLIDLAAEATVTKVEHYEMRKALERHVVNERKMLVQAERISRSLKDPRMKPLLKTILADERRHHKALSTLLGTIVEEEKISEDDWWDYLNEWAVFST
jgi:rubrerythrin